MSDATGKRPRTHMGDTERASSSKRRTPPYGAKVPETEFDNEEVTQPPQAPPSQPQLADMPIEERVTILHQSMEQMAAGFERVWPARNVESHLGAVIRALDAITKESTQTAALLREFVMPGLKQVMSRLDGIERTVSSESGRQARFYEHDWPRLVDSTEKIDRRTDLVERQLDRVERQLDQAEKRTEDTGKTLRQKQEEQDRVIEQLAVRTRSLEDGFLGIKAKVAAVSFLIGGGGAGSAVAVYKLFFS